MSTLERVSWALTGGYLALSAVRIGLSVRHWVSSSMVEPVETRDPLVEPVETRVSTSSTSGGARSTNGDRVSTSSTNDGQSSTSSTNGGITVLQPILSGDPGLPDVLAANLRNHPDAHFLWLVDADDPEGRAITARLAAASERVRVVLCPPCPELTNPKVIKLALGVRECATELFAVLDDDTELPPGSLARARAALASADLATGLPWYRAGAGPWAALVAGFVNGNSLISYFALPGEPVSINGMFYLTSRTALARAGGFEAILDRVCDDLELARLYRAAGLRLAQTTITHPVATDIPDAASYGRLMHRWMVFASRLFRTSMTWPLALLVVLPGALPPVALGVAVAAGSGAAAAGIGAAVAVKVLAAQGVRAGLAPQIPRRFWAEYAADWLLPLQAAAASVRSGRIEWRGRRLRIVDGRLR